MDEKRVLSLVEPDTDAERLLGQVVVSMARGRSVTMRRLLAECQVALAIGASFCDATPGPWDLQLRDGRKVEVQATRADTFAVNRLRRAIDLWVFVHVTDSEATDRFTLATRGQIDALQAAYPRDRTSAIYVPTATVASWGLLTAAQLRRAVKSA